MHNQKPAIEIFLMISRCTCCRTQFHRQLAHMKSGNCLHLREKLSLQLNCGRSESRHRLQFSQNYGFSLWPAGRRYILSEKTKLPDIYHLRYR